MVEKVSQPDEESSTIIEGELMLHESSQSNIQVQEEIIDTEKNEVASNDSSLTTTFTSPRPCKKNASISSRQRSDNVVKSKRSRTSLQAKKALCKAKRVRVKYPSNQKGKRKLEHRWGPHVQGNNLGKKRNKCGNTSFIMHDELKKF